jgi:hypothetical protein
MRGNIALIPAGLHKTGFVAPRQRMISPTSLFTPAYKGSSLCGRSGPDKAYKFRGAGVSELTALSPRRYANGKRKSVFDGAGVRNTY